MAWLTTPAFAQAETAAQAAQTAAKAADTLITQGGIYGSIAVIVGLAVVAIIVSLSWVIRGLWNTIKGRDELIAALQDKRAADAASSAKLLAEVATKGSETIAANTTAQAELTNRTQGLAELIRPIGPDLQRALMNLDRNGDKMDDIGRQLASAGHRP